MKTAPSTIVLGWALLLYAGSLVLPAFECGGDRPFLRFPMSDDPVGIILLGFGWLGLLVSEPRWFANIFFLLMVLGLKQRNKKPKHLVYPLIVTITAISCLFVPARACGSSYTFSKSLAIGGYLWVIAVITVSIIYTLRHWQASVQMFDARP